MVDIKTGVITDKPENGEAEVIQKRWFYNALSESGAMSKGSAESPTEFRSVLENANIAWIDYVARDFALEAHSVARELGFSESLASPLIADYRVTYQDLDTEMGLRIPAIQVRDLEVQANPLLILVKKNFILTIHPVTVDRRFTLLRRYSETFLRKIPSSANSQDKLTMLLMRILDHNNDRNFEHLRQIEERGDELSEIMIQPEATRTKIGPEIHRMKHSLITYLNALWNSLDVIHTLRYGDAELITDDPKLLEKLGVVADDVSRQIGLAEHLSEVLASGLEVLQSIYNNQLQSLNNRLAMLMSWLTIIGTALLVPNTLATMLGNGVFDIGPKDMGWYLALMIGSTLGATGLVYFWVKRAGWIPKNMD